MSTVSSVKRVNIVDVVRGSALIGILLIHSMAGYLSVITVNWVWNAMHVVVVWMIWCSGYVFAMKELGKHLGDSRWYIRRVQRIYIPYVIYCISLFFLVSLFRWLRLSGDAYPSFPYIARSLLMVSGVDVGWFSLLCIQLLLLSPIYSFLLSRRQMYVGSMWILGIILFFLFLFRIPSTYSRLISWVPWSFVFLFGAGYSQHARQRGGETISLFDTGKLFFWSASIYSFLSFWIWYVGGSTVYVHHKYPPDLWYVSYGVMMLSVYLFFYACAKNILVCFCPMFQFCSTRAYGLFLLHLLMLFVIRVIDPGISLGMMILSSFSFTIIFSFLWSM